jgi:hypothetical protein
VADSRLRLRVLVVVPICRRQNRDASRVGHANVDRSATRRQLAESRVGEQRQVRLPRQVSAGEAVRPVIRSTDGVHGFAIPTLKIDVLLPKSGEPATAEFTAPAPGRYEIACSEFCGGGHGRMKAACSASLPHEPVNREKKKERVVRINGQ